MMHATLLHVMFSYLLCGTTCFVVYVLKWPKSATEENELNHVFYTFWQLLGLVSQMLIISAALILCITYDNVTRKSLILTLNQRRLIAIVGVVNIVGGLVNMSSLLSRSMVATFLLPRYDQLSLYILPMSVSVIQMIVAVILLMELDMCSPGQQKEVLSHSTDDGDVTLSLIESVLSAHDLPYVIIMPDQMKKDAKLDQ